MTCVRCAARCFWMFPVCGDNAHQRGRHGDTGQRLAVSAERAAQSGASNCWAAAGHWWTTGCTVTGAGAGRPPPPAPVREAAIMLTCWMFKRYQAAYRQDNAAVPELGQILYGEAMPKQVVALLTFRNGTVML